jgi:hypothetical protein
MTTHYDNVADEGLSQYQVAGLKNLDFKKISERIKKSGGSEVSLISEHMDYRLLKVDGRSDPPRDALNICKLLALDNEILGAIEEKYK